MTADSSHWDETSVGEGASPLQPQQQGFEEKIQLTFHPQPPQSWPQSPVHTRCVTSGLACPSCAWGLSWKSNTRRKREKKYRLLRFYCRLLKSKESISNKALVRIRSGKVRGNSGEDLFVFFIRSKSYSSGGQWWIKPKPLWDQGEGRSLASG